MFSGSSEVLHPHNTLEHGVRVRVPGRDGHDTGAVDEVDPAHKGDVLPDLGLSGNGSDGADLLLFEGIDDGGLSDIGVPDETDRDLFLIRVEDRELAEKLDERSFTERVVDGCVKGDGGG